MYIYIHRYIYFLDLFIFLVATRNKRQYVFGLATEVRVGALGFRGEGLGFRTGFKMASTFRLRAVRTCRVAKGSLCCTCRASCGTFLCSATCSQNA